MKNYDYIGLFCDGFATVCLNDKWGFIDENDVEICELKYDCICEFVSGFAYVSIGKKVDLDNETIQNIMNLQKSGGNETFVKPTTDEELRLVDEFKKASK
jgi:hypothetical protein